jgi:hypothetical protein
MRFVPLALVCSDPLKRTKVAITHGGRKMQCSVSAQRQLALPRDEEPRLLGKPAIPSSRRQIQDLPRDVSLEHWLS